LTNSLVGTYEANFHPNFSSTYINRVGEQQMEGGF